MPHPLPRCTVDILDSLDETPGVRCEIINAIPLVAIEIASPYSESYGRGRRTHAWPPLGLDPSSVLDVRAIFAGIRRDPAAIWTSGARPLTRSAGPG